MLPDFLVDELREFRSNGYKPNPDGRVFGEASKGSLGRILKAAALRAGIRELPPSSLKNSHVYILAQLGYDPLTIGNRVGDRFLYIASRYAKFFSSPQTELINDLEKLRRKPRGTGEESNDIPWRKTS